MRLRHPALAPLLAFVLLAGALFGCATQQGTSQALTIAGAAAVVVGASMAADNPCSQVTPEGPGPGYCSQGLSRGARNAGTAIAVAGAGLAAAGYALQPKGPDRLQGGANALPPPAAPYRLVRPASVENSEPESAQAEAPAREQDCSASASNPSREEPGSEEPSQPVEASPPCAPKSGAGRVNGAGAPGDPPVETADPATAEPSREEQPTPEPSSPE